MKFEKPTNNCPADGVSFNQEKFELYAVSFPVRSIVKAASVVQVCKTSCNNGMPGC